MADTRNTPKTASMGDTPTIPPSSTNSTAAQCCEHAQTLLSPEELDMTEQADKLSQRLTHLAQIVKLAAFAAEARRTLEGARQIMQFRPELHKAIMDAVPAADNWMGIEDPSGELLGYVASQLNEVNTDFTESFYGLAVAAKFSANAGGKGGAA